MFFILDLGLGMKIGLGSPTYDVGVCEVISELAIGLIFKFYSYLNLMIRTAVRCSER
jgi:hypothetical protein